MIKKEDIRRAVKTFKKWDNDGLWDNTDDVFIQHNLAKSKDAIRTARYILRIMEEEQMKELFDAEGYNGTLWIINTSYYSIFFLAQYLLAIEGKRLPKNTDDTHKMTELALLYYFIIKGSGFEGKDNFSWEDIKQSRMSKALELLSEAKEETDELTQRAKKMIEHISAERNKRNQFTYQMNIDAELNKAKTSIRRALEFSDIVNEFVQRNS